MFYRVLLLLMILFGLNENGNSQKISVQTLVGTNLSHSGYRVTMPSDAIVELNEFSYSGMAGIQGDYKINDYISFGIGLRWGFLNFGINDDCYYCDRIWPGGGSKVRRWEIPVYVRGFFRPQTKKIAPYFSTGISNQFVNVNRVRLGHKIHWNMGAGVLFNLNEHWAIDTGLELGMAVNDNNNRDIYSTQELMYRLGIQRRF